MWPRLDQIPDRGSCRIAGVGGDDAAELAPAADRAVAGGAEIDLKHIVPDLPPPMRTLDIVMAHPCAQDVIELGPAEADEEIQAFALDGADEGFREGIGVRRPVRDLDDPGSFRRPDGIEAGAELGVGVADQETRRDLLVRAPHQRIAGLLGHPCRVGGVGRGAAEHAAAAEMDEDQHIGRQRPAGGKHSLGEEVAGHHAFHMCPDEGGPRQGRLLLPLLGAGVDARLIEDALDRVGAGIEPELFQLPGDPLVAPKKVFRSDADDNIAQFLRETWPSYRLEGTANAHLGEPALVGRGLGHFHQPVDIMPAFFPDAQQFGFFGRREDDPLGRDAGPQDRDLGLQQSQLRVVPRHEELVQEDHKEG